MIDHMQLISVGDMIEAINGQSLLGCRHYEVARLLKELPRGRTFTLKLTEPRKAFGEPAAAAPLPPHTHPPTQHAHHAHRRPRPVGPGATSRWRPKPSLPLWEKRGHPPTHALPHPAWSQEGVLAPSPAWEKGRREEEVAPTPGFQEPLAQPSAPNPGLPRS